jgi:TatD DNase family protein
MLIDAHAHLDRYGADLQRVLSDLHERRIFTIGTSMDVPSYESTLEIASRCDLVLPTFGIHPKNAPRYAARLSEIGRFIERSPAIGEIGLDFHWVEDEAVYPAQNRVLQYFLAAAREQNKLVNLHTKGAEKEILDLLERYDVRRAIVHWYSGPLDILRELIDYGAYFTIGVEVLFSEHIQTIARELPESLLLAETDNPGGLAWLTGEPGMPGALQQVVAALARVRSTTFAAMADSIARNFLRLIDRDPWLAPLRPHLLILSDG